MQAILGWGNKLLKGESSSYSNTEKTFHFCPTLDPPEEAGAGAVSLFLRMEAAYHRLGREDAQEANANKLIIIGLFHRVCF